jgi:hypothetical protein
MVSISVGQDEQSPTQNITSVVVEQDQVIVRFVGIPGVEYRIESTASLSNPEWQLLAVATAGLNGRFEARDVTPPEQVRFYRAVFVLSQAGAAK